MFENNGAKIVKYLECSKYFPKNLQTPSKKAPRIAARGCRYCLVDEMNPRFYVSNYVLMLKRERNKSKLLYNYYRMQHLLSYQQRQQM